MISVFIVNIYMKVLVFILLCLCKYGVQPPGVRKNDLVFIHHVPQSTFAAAWVKVFRIIPDFRISRVFVPI